MTLKALLPLLLATAASAAFAQDGPSADALVGTCQLSSQHASGARVSTLVELKANQQFGTVTTLDGRPLRTASGTWKLVGRGLEWTYLDASHLTVAQGPVIVDDVQSVDAQQLTLRSRSSGQVQVCQRVRYQASVPAQ